MKNIDASIREGHKGPEQHACRTLRYRETLGAKIRRPISITVGEEGES